VTIIVRTNTRNCLIKISSLQTRALMMQILNVKFLIFEFANSYSNYNGIHSTYYRKIHSSQSVSEMLEKN